MLAAHKSRPELSTATLRKGSRMRFCYRGMKEAFVDEDGAPGPPHLVTGNKMRFATVEKMLEFMFLVNDNPKKAAWKSAPFRLIIQKSQDFIESQCGYRAAEKWLDEFFFLVKITHWILPYPSDRALIESTKTSQKGGLQGQMM